MQDTGTIETFIDEPSWQFLELALTQAILDPQPDLGLITDLACQMDKRPCALRRAMFTAVRHAPLIHGGRGFDYLAVVDVLLELGVALPHGAAWVAYGDQLTQRVGHARAQEMTRLVVRRGGTGVEALRRTAARWPEQTRAHAMFLKSLD